MPNNIVSNTPSKETKTVFVVGFVTDSGTGGFEWSLFRDTIETFRKTVVGIDTDVTEVREITVPRHMMGDELTDWINARDELWEPAEGEGRESI